MLLRSGRRREEILHDVGEETTTLPPPPVVDSSLTQPIQALPQAAPPPPSDDKQRKLDRLLPPRVAAMTDSFIKSNAELGLLPTLDRIASAVYVESGGTVTMDSVRRYVRLKYPEYTVTRNMPITLAKNRFMRTLFGSRLGFYMMDLAFLRKTVAGFSHHQYACLVLYCCAGTQLMLLETIYDNKSARALQRALEACHDRLINVYQRKEGLKRLYSDREGGMLSEAMRQWLKERKIELVFTGIGKAQKSYLAEGAIKRLRVQLKRQRILLGPQFNPYDQLARIEKGHNEQKLMIGKAISSWSPSSITSKSYPEYIRYVYSLTPIAYFSLYSLGDGYIDYKFNLDDVVFLKQRYVSSKSLEKRSVNTVNTTLYRIAARFTILSGTFTLVAYYRILPAFDLLTEVTPETMDQTLNARGLFVPEGALTAE